MIGLQDGKRRLQIIPFAVMPLGNWKGGRENPRQSSRYFIPSSPPSSVGPGVGCRAFSFRAREDLSPLAQNAQSKPCTADASQKAGDGFSKGGPIRAALPAT